MLLNINSVKQNQQPKLLKRNPHNKLQPQSIVVENGQNSTFISDREIALTKAIGLIEQGKNTHYYSFGNYNLVRLIVYLLRQTGPAHVFMSTYSFSTKSIHQLNNLIEKKQILSFKLILDNRVRSISPKPFQMIAASFNYRCISVHAKLALIWNEKWHITIVTSQNATDNPKMERGIIFTCKEIFQFDLQNLNNGFLRGTT